MGIAAAAVMLAIYAAITVRDPMAKRVKSLNERRDQLKSGILTVHAKKRQSIVRRNDTTDSIKTFLESLKVLQDSQLMVIQQKLAQAGIRKKEWAVAVVLGRMIFPIVLGVIFGVLIYWVNYFPLWSDFKKFGLFAGMVGLGRQGPGHLDREPRRKAHQGNSQGPARCARSAGDLRRSRPHCRCGLWPCRRELGRAYPELGDEFALTAIELSFLTERRAAFENFAYRVNLDSVRGVVTTMIQTGTLRYAARLGTARALGRIPQRAHDARGRKGRASACDHDDPAYSVHPADAVRRDPRASSLLDQRTTS